MDSRVEIYVWEKGERRPDGSDCFDILELPRGGLAPMKDDILTVQGGRFRVVERVLLWTGVGRTSDQDGQPFLKMWLYVRTEDE